DTLEPAILCAIHHAHAAPPDLAVQLVVGREGPLDVRAELRIRRRNNRIRQAISSGSRTGRTRQAHLGQLGMLARRETYGKDGRRSGRVTAQTVLEPCQPVGAILEWSVRR